MVHANFERKTSSLRKRIFFRNSHISSRGTGRGIVRAGGRGRGEGLVGGTTDRLNIRGADVD